MCTIEFLGNDLRITKTSMNTNTTKKAENLVGSYLNRRPKNLILISNMLKFQGCKMSWKRDETHDGNSLNLSAIELEIPKDLNF